MKGLPLAAAWLVGLWVAGCASPAPSKLNYGMMRIESASRAEVMPAAEQAVREHFRIATTDPAAGVIEAHPLEGSEPGRTRRAGDMLGAHRRVRRVAQVRVVDAEDGVNVFCKVLVQQYESDERRLFAREHALSDTPIETPAAAEAATSAEQNATWRARGRDKVLERQILQAIDERIAARSR
ncbi:MAG: hypothetical protein JSV19_11055 [Phycisphaerales bacterium]|nr:MAG: hypothetical protein JSV19_11055 [Phycisphaerales bacterium]